ncbi:MAG: MFS transporter [Candidatus Promineifilaceae bacterium]
MAQQPPPTDKVSPRWQNVRQLPRNIWVLTLASFFTDVSTDMLVHLIPFFLANVLGVRTVTIGLIEGLAETTASLVKLISGQLSDRLGRYKGLTVAGYGLSTLAKPFFALAGSWTAILTVRFAERIGKGVRTAPRDVLIADSIDEKQRGLAFGLHRAGDTAGAALGLIIALLVLWFLQGNEIDLTRQSFQTIVWLSILPALTAVLLLVFGVREKRDKTPKTAAAKRPSYKLSQPFKQYLIILVIFTLGNSSDAFLMLRAQTTGLTVLQVMGLLVIFNLVYAFLSGPAGSLSDKVGRQLLLLGGWVLYALIYIGFAFGKTHWQIAVLFALYGIYYGLTQGVAKAFVADLVPKEQRGTAYGWFNAVIGLAVLPASLLAGLLWQGIGSWSGFGVQMPFLVGAVLSIIAAGLLILWFPPNKPTMINHIPQSH